MVELSRLEEDLDALVKRRPDVGIDGAEFIAELDRLSYSGLRFVARHAPWLEKEWKAARPQPIGAWAVLFPRTVAAQSALAEIRTRKSILKAVLPEVRKAGEERVSQQARATPVLKPKAKTSIKRKQGCTILVVTPLEEERDAVLEHLAGVKRVSPNNSDVRVYYRGRLWFSSGRRRGYDVVVLCLLEMGRVDAAAAVVSAINRWKPRGVLAVGIAGGFRDQVDLGDVLIADQIIDYEAQKVRGRSSETRYRSDRADARMLSVARSIKVSEWGPLVRQKRPERGRAVKHVGPVFSGEKVVANGKFLSTHRRAYPKALGVEMEGSGIAAACARTAKNPGFLMVRGVSDFGDRRKNASNVEKWRSYACASAAAFAVALLRAGPFPT